MNMPATLSYLSLNITASTGTVAGDGTNTLSMQSGGSITIGPNSGTLQLGVSTNMLPLDLLGQVQFSVPSATQLIADAGLLQGSGGITKTGSGRLRFNTDNTGYSGAVTVSAGTLILFTSDGIGSGSATLDGGTLSLQNSATSFPNAITADSAAGNAFDVPSIAATASGFISGSGGFTKTGSGTLTLSHTNNYSGGTTIVAGALRLGSSSGSGTGSVSVGSSSIFDVNGFAPVITELSGTGSVTLGAGTPTSGDSGASTFSGPISGSGTMVLQGTGTLSLTGTNSSFSGGTFITGGGLLAISGDGSLGAAPGSPATNITFSGSGGTLQAANNFTINANRSVSVAAAATFDTNGKLLSVPGLTSGTGTLTVTGNGTLTSGPVRVDTLDILGTTYHSLIKGQSDSGTTVLNNLSIASSSGYTATLDINDIKLILQSTGATGNKTGLISYLQNAATSGSNGGLDTGTWTGTGLTSSTLASDYTAGTNHSYHTTMAIADNGELSAPFSTYGGQSVDSNSIIVTRALIGDGNLDNTVNNADYVIVLTHFGDAGVTTSGGDYNQDGTVNNADLVALLTNYGQSLPDGYSLTPAGLSQPAAGPASPVPEPVSAAALLPAVLLLRRRKRR